MVAAFIGQTIDPAGRGVVFDEAASRRIVEQHPEMAAWIHQIIPSVTFPDVIKADPRPGRERFYRRRAGPAAWLMVVVDFERGTGSIVTAFGSRRGPGAK